MKSPEAGNIIVWSENDHDRDYVRRVAQSVYRSYDGTMAQWSMSEADPLWEISFGGRAGVVGVDLEGRVSCVKLFYDERLRNKCRVLMGLAKGKRAYRHGLRLRALGVTCPRMLGYAERRPTGPALIVTELVTDGLRLDHWAAQRGVQRDALPALARFIRHMHDQGVSHVDFSARNILIRPRAEGYEFLLLDYEDARFGRRVTRRRRLHNLHHLHERMMQYVAVKDRLRFLRVYASQDYRTWRDTLRRMTRRTAAQWLPPQAGVKTTSIPSQGST